MAICQNNSYTNIDTNYFQQQWSSSFLNVTKFRNNLELYDATNDSYFFKINKPAYIKKSINGKIYFFYNWRAVGHPDTLAPKGFKIASSVDYKNIFKKQELLLKSTNSNSSSDKSLVDYLTSPFYVHFVGYFDEAGYDPTEKYQFYWTDNSQLGSDVAITQTFTIDENLKNVVPDTQPMDKDFGYLVLCIENLEETAKNSLFDYRSLMPKEYEKLLINLVSITKEQHTFSNGDIVSINGKIGFSRNGSSLSKLNNIEFGFNFRNQKIAESMIQKQLLSFTSKPYYKGYLLQSETDFNLSIKHQEMPYNRKQELYPLRIKNPSAYNSADIERAYWCDFKCNIIEKKFTVTDNGNIITSEITKGIESFKSKGPIYALGSVVPGLGLSSIRSFYFISTSITALWISSLSLGAVSIASKLYSNHYYKQYRNDIYNSNADENYKKANVAQKIFLSSAIGYGVLGILDFSFTFTIGCKNKSAQRQLNKSIKTKGVILLK